MWATLVVREVWLRGETSDALMRVGPGVELVVLASTGALSWGVVAFEVWLLAETSDELLLFLLLLLFLRLV